MSNCYTPKEYAETFYHGKVTPRTVQNWIKANRLPEGTKVDMTPTGYYLIIVEQQPQNNVDNLVALLESKVA